MVGGTSRMSNTTIKRQPTNQRKRKLTRADPTQTRILLKSYDAEARPSADQFAEMSQKTNLSVTLISFTPFLIPLSALVSLILSDLPQRS